MSRSRCRLCATRRGRGPILSAQDAAHSPCRPRERLKKSILYGPAVGVLSCPADQVEAASLFHRLGAKSRAFPRGQAIARSQVCASGRASAGSPAIVRNRTFTRSQTFAKDRAFLSDRASRKRGKPRREARSGNPPQAEKNRAAPVTASIERIDCAKISRRREYAFFGQKTIPRGRVGWTAGGIPERNTETSPRR